MATHQQLANSTAAAAAATAAASSIGSHVVCRNTLVMLVARSLTAADALSPLCLCPASACLTNICAAEPDLLAAAVLLVRSARPTSCLKPRTSAVPPSPFLMPQPSRLWTLLLTHPQQSPTLWPAGAGLPAPPAGRPTLQRTRCPGPVRSRLSSRHQTGAAHGVPGEPTPTTANIAIKVDQVRTGSTEAQTTPCAPRHS